MSFEEFKVNIPEGEKNGWVVRRITVTEDQSKWDRIRNAVHGSRRYTPAGTYTQLLTPGRNIMMSDTPDEIRDHMTMIYRAKGHVLINGLGIGVVLQACLNKDEVTHATIIELSQDVIDLVAPHYREKYGERLTIIKADALEYAPPKGERYGAVWHDIWPYICNDNLEEMKRLHRKYGRRTEWQGSWCRELIEADIRREKRKESMYDWD
jgi:hypothetical protein